MWDSGGVQMTAPSAPVEGRLGRGGDGGEGEVLGRGLALGGRRIVGGEGLHARDAEIAEVAAADGA